MSGWYELKKGQNEQFHFVLKAGNGEVILSSEMYKTKAAAENGIASIRKNCDKDAQYEKKTSTNGKFYFSLKAANHQIIGTSQMYASEDSRDNGIASVKINGTSEIIKELL